MLSMERNHRLSMERDHKLPMERDHRLPMCRSAAELGAVTEAHRIRRPTPSGPALTERPRRRQAPCAGTAGDGECRDRRPRDGQERGARGRQ